MVRERTDTAALIIFASLMFAGLEISAISAIVPDNTRGTDPFNSSTEFNITGADIVNHTMPSGYGTSPAQIDVRVGIADTSFPGPKGEMAAGPRTIGFTADPLLLAALVVTTITGAISAYLLVQKKT